MVKKKRSVKSSYNKRGPQLQGKAFWAIMGVLFILATITIIYSPDSSYVTGNTVVQKVAFAKADSFIIIQLSELELVKDIKLTFSEEVKDKVVRVEEIEKVSWNFKGESFSMFKVSFDEPEKVKQIELRIKIDKDDYKLKKFKLYCDGKELKTEVEKEWNDYIYYKATSDKLGEFVIGIAEEKEEVPKAKVSPKIERKEPVPLAKKEIVLEIPIEEEESFLTKLKEFLGIN